MGLLFRDADMIKQKTLVGRALTAEQCWLFPLDYAAALGTGISSNVYIHPFSPVFPSKFCFSKVAVLGEVDTLDL